MQVHSFVPRLAGPHPRGSFEVLFTREAFAEYVPWLMFERRDVLEAMDASTCAAGRSEEEIIERTKRH